MPWKDKFWTAYGVVTNIACGVSIKTLNIVGTVGCMAGGVLFSVSNYINETLSASYYGAAQATGDVVINFNILEANFTFNQTVPFRYDASTDQSLMSYSLGDYLPPATLQSVSIVLGVSGILLRNISATIKQWQEGRIDAAYHQKKHRLNIGSPSVEEYVYANAASFSGSISLMLASSAFAEALINYSGFPGSAQSLTYPFNSALHVNTQHYNGTVASVHYPLEYQVNQNTTVKLPIVGITVQLLEQADAIASANLTYGGGVFLKSQSKNGSPVVAPVLTSTAICSHVGQSFFVKKGNEAKIERIRFAERDRTDHSINQSDEGETSALLQV